MANERDNIQDIPLEALADRPAKRYVDQFGNALVLRAKLLAYERSDDLVLRSHIDEAFIAIGAERRQRARRELLIALGGALFGAFIQGFITEISAVLIRPVWVSVYVVLGLVGLVLLVWGISGHRRRGGVADSRCGAGRQTVRARERS